MANKIVISFKVDPEIKEALERLSSADDRSLSSYIDRLLRKHVADSGGPEGTKKTTSKRK